MSSRGDLYNTAIGTCCQEYGQMDNILKVPDLYSEDVQEVKRATEAIKERMDYRCAQPDS